ncbi:methyltransferase [Altererythrobacter sp. TH136]|uniref:methyltransferase n=1 Tax=Altererythrobacter sp. TH136 TaxID=2067415 RepID=UPI0011631232|nr:methyltransferase [Altererythrobacter sp. TH136]QDM41525.1 methyltransferase [Altererythrobacter sp. TH136]
MLALLEALKQRGYAFVSPTPATHQRVIARPHKALAGDLRDVFGWSLPFRPDLLEPELCRIVIDGGLAEVGANDLLKATVRVSSLGDNLIVHSAYPTVHEDAVFFGPDSYRFANLIEQELGRLDSQRVTTALDIGTGAGVGAIVIRQGCPSARVLATDVNPKALRFAAVNAQAAGAQIEFIETSGIPHPDLPIDLAVANPPYIIDGASRAYRDGGDLHGAQVAMDMVADTLPRLSARGTMILYTGSAIIDGADGLKTQLQGLAAAHQRALNYRTLDPDVFGEELANPSYRDVERIELVAAVFLGAN